MAKHNRRSPQVAATKAPRGIIAEIVEALRSSGDEESRRAKCVGLLDARNRLSPDDIKGLIAMWLNAHCVAALKLHNRDDDEAAGIPEDPGQARYDDGQRWGILPCLTADQDQDLGNWLLRSGAVKDALMREGERRKIDVSALVPANDDLRNPLALYDLPAGSRQEAEGRLLEARRALERLRAGLGATDEASGKSGRLQETDDKPDEKGFVKSPSDKTAYRSASKIVCDFPANATTVKDLNRILAENPHIRRWKPNKQRLSVHLGDWQKYVDSRANTSAGGWSDDPTEVERRKAEIRAKKVRAGKPAST